MVLIVFVMKRLILGINQRTFIGDGLIQILLIPKHLYMLKINLMFQGMEDDLINTEQFGTTLTKTIITGNFYE